MKWLPANRYLRFCAGIAVVLLGIAGLLLPIVPGWALIFVGLFILAEDFHWARRMVDGLLRMLEHHGGETVRRYVEDYRRNRARREAARDERSSD